MNQCVVFVFYLYLENLFAQHSDAKNVFTM